MAYTRSFEGVKPPRRFDDEPYVQVNVREGASHAGPFNEIDTIVLSPVDTDPAQPLSRNLTTAEALLAHGWYILQWEDGDGALFDSDIIEYGDSPAVEAPGNLVSVEDYKLLSGHDVEEDKNDESIAKAIQLVSQIIRTYTDRDFKAPPVTETRSYTYNGGRYIQIDDCSLISAVELDGRPVGAADYIARPHGELVFYYIELRYPGGSRHESPAMGFTSNRDRFPAAPSGTVYADVTGTFGWATVPDDVQLAAVEMVGNVLTLPGSGPAGEYVSEQLAEYSYSRESDNNFGRWANRSLSTLDYYRRINQ